MPVIDASLTQWVGEGAPFREVAPLRATQVELSEALREEMRRRQAQRTHPVRTAFANRHIVAAKVNDVDPQAWVADVLARFAELPHTRVHERVPWNWKAVRDQSLAA